jgi:hypothetical protein
VEVELKVWVFVGNTAMEAAVADLGLVLDERLPLGALLVIPLGLAGDDGVSGQVAVRVEVLVTLSRLPPEQPLLGDPETVGKVQAVSEMAVPDEPLCDFGTMRSSQIQSSHSPSANGCPFQWVTNWPRLAIRSAALQ